MQGSWKESSKESESEILLDNCYVYKSGFPLRIQARFSTAEEAVQGKPYLRSIREDVSLCHKRADGMVNARQRLLYLKQLGQSCRLQLQRVHSDGSEHVR